MAYNIVKVSDMLLGASVDSSSEAMKWLMHYKKKYPQRNFVVVVTDRSWTIEDISEVELLKSMPKEV